jgi:hypothetical protein
MNSQNYRSTILTLHYRLKVNVENIPSCIQGRFKNENIKFFSRHRCPLRPISQAGSIVWVNRLFYNNL